MPFIHITAVRPVHLSRVDHVEIAAWYPDLPPMLLGENMDAYTNRLTGADGTRRRPYDHRRRRQCSLNWHTECTDPAGEDCKCPCHRSCP